MRSLLAALPLAILLAIYLIADPFRVIYNHYPYYDGLNPLPDNKAYANVTAYINGRQHYHYNAFIFGNSRSCYFPVAAWKTHLPADARPIHLDASSETLYGMAAKMKFIESQGDTIKYALIEISPWGFTNDSINPLNAPLPFRIPWQLQGAQDYLPFQYAFFRDFLSRPTWIALSKYYLSGYRENTPDAELFKVPLQSYKVESSETIDDTIEHLINTTPEVFYADRKSALDQALATPFRFVTDRPITRQQRQALTDMAAILKRHHTDYQIIIGPTGSHQMPSPQNLSVLKSIFNPRRVHDMSRFAPAFNTPYAFYDPTHFRPFIGIQLMDSAYSTF